VGAETTVPNDDAIASAADAGLRWVSDTAPGIRRRMERGKPVYLDNTGKRVTDEAVLGRIRSLAIPPAWTDVWICPSPRGHIQATGRDARGRKQYRYHPKWREVRDENKYARMIAFGKALPGIRRRVKKDLSRPGLPREKALASVVGLLETTLIRVGNDEYARSNNSVGLTTMRDRHVQVNGSELRFSFRGKGGKEHTVDIRDRRLARVVKQSQDLPGYELFQYLDDEGERRSVDASDVNAYLQEIAGEEFTAKDFRTWAGTVLASVALQEFEEFDSEAQAKRNVVRAVERVAERLGNTPAICRKCYVHPAVVESYLEGTMLEALRDRTRGALKGLSRLEPEEAAVLVLLQSRLDRTANPNGRRTRSPRRAR
jgi:DNA topoisomerase-1